MIFRRYFVGVHYFFYLCKTKVKNETKVKLITITYWIKWLLVTRVFVQIHGMYECITSWCVLELLRTSLLIAYLLSDLWDVIFIYRLLIVSEMQFCRLLFNCVYSDPPMSLFMPHGMCRIYACCSVVLSIALVSSALMLGHPVAMPTDLVRKVQLWDAGSRPSSARLRDVALSSRVAVASRFQTVERETPRCCFIESCSCS